MQLAKWRRANQRFEPGSRLSEKQWQQLIRDGVINGQILGPYTLVDVDQLDSSIELQAKTHDDIPDLLS